ncbi:cupin domain-containing protein [Dactylosporangium sp. AC04546]|uniref:cupin domain-containing protein n=1 Tax=Dactylosporangium sp. AC04546 TaxID=2862460 RepID=UPI001EE01F6B|nr:cupin domain-containing protein [Dactylosporangium sp. AC04546]WVK79079.1 cupin domain-containing protein [Dactylosporangium sp. AC04546]
MRIRHLDRAALHPDNAYSQRLLPWPELNAPFEGAWCVVNPHSATTAHAHHEYEIFIAVSGQGVLASAGERVPFVEGDVVHFPPHVEHQVVNETDEPLQFYAVWWDAPMTAVFAERHGSHGSTEA